VHGSFAYVAASSAEAAAVIDISNPAHPRFVFGLYDPNHLWHTTGVDLDPTAGELILTSPFQQGQGNVLYPPFPNQAGGPTDTGTVSALDLTPTASAVPNPPSSDPPAQTTQTTASFAFTTSDTVSSARCQLDGGPLGLCTSATTMSYSGLGSGAHTFTVEAIDAAGNVSAPASYAWTVTTHAPKPVITAISPSAGPRRGGTTVTLTGTGFSGATKVTFGTLAATSYTVVSATRITAVSPAQAPGSVYISVTTAGGTSANVAADRYTYND
jgi:hypothetical protein